MTQLSPAVSNNDNVYGNPKAPIELVEYGDYECPYCGRAYPVLKRIQQQFGPDLVFVFRNFPLSKVHPNAVAAAIATEAAGLQGKFWEMHDIIFENQRALNETNILTYANKIGLDTERFQKDILQEKLAHKVDKDFESGLRSGVNRTPTLFVNGVKYDEILEEGKFLQHLKSRLAQMAI